jgi:DNA-binding XRE family transcriptional regulator
MGGRGSGRRPDTKRRERARALRRQGKTIPQIAQILGVTKQWAHQLLGQGPRRRYGPLHCPGCGAALGVLGLPGGEGPCLECLKRPGAWGHGDRLRAHRLAAKLSPAALGRRAGVSCSTVQRLEQGGGSPTPGTLAKLARALGIGVGDLEPGRG